MSPLAKIKQNWKSGLTVSLVSLPLNIALSIASGAGPIPGVITGVWACLIASLLGGSNYNIIGAAGALTTILAIFSSIGFMGGNLVFALPFLAILTGLIVLLVYLLRLERYLIYIPSSVMYGFAAGVAVLIAMNQLNDALALYNLPKHSHFLARMGENLIHAGEAHWPSAAVFLIFLSILLVFKKFIKQIPGVIPVSILGIGLGYLDTYGFLNIGLTTLLEKQGQVLATLWKPLQIESFLALVSRLENLSLFFNTAVVVALVAILETLITAKIADKITGTKFNSRRELLGLGMANIASGLMGGLPATGVFIRTGLNIKSGASDKMSATIAAICTGILALLFLPFFQYIPMPVIAAILFNTAIGLIEMEKFERFWQEDKQSFIVGILVAAITVIEDASIGILAGVALALLFFVDKLSKGNFEATFNVKKRIIQCNHGNCFAFPDKNVDVIVYSIGGIMAYVDGPQHRENFEKMGQMLSLETVIIRLRDLFYIDLDGIDLLEEAVVELTQMNKQVLVTGPSEEIAKVLDHSKVFRQLKKEGKIFAKTEKALQSLGFDKEDMGIMNQKISENLEKSDIPKIEEKRDKTESEKVEFAF